MSTETSICPDDRVIVGVEAISMGSWEPLELVPDERAAAYAVPSDENAWLVEPWAQEVRGMDDSAKQMVKGMIHLRCLGIFICLSLSFVALL